MTAYHGVADRVVARWRADAVLAANGRNASWEGTSCWLFEGAKIAEWWVHFDLAEVQRQTRPQKEEATQ
ncbi:MAG: ester cyclase [Chloroflexi bacterium]|nr:ester cyclase [Chloroflexota bacterium]MCZ7576924.1 ester cyclase [Dehalococcoidia bacterium]